MSLKKIAILFLIITNGQVFAQEIDSSAKTETILEEIELNTQINPSIKLNNIFATQRYKAAHFQKNATPNLTEAVSLINGIQSQQNCNVCNTNEIRINGMSGPYTLVLIDDMPIVSALATVYGFNSIPMSMIESIEVTKGPTNAYYPSEAMGGVINIKTKEYKNTSSIYTDVMGTSWGEINTDFSTKWKPHKKIEHIISANYFHFSNIVDKNNDGFTDISLNNKISFFNKFSFKKDNTTIGHLAARYMYEDRWGGQTHYQHKDRGQETVYGESIYTNRLEVIGQYTIPTTEDIKLYTSYNFHHQNSYYGITPYLAQQHTSYNQLIWNKKFNNKIALISGATLRYNGYDDNTSATAQQNGVNQPDNHIIPGLFTQSDIHFNHHHQGALGFRTDYHSKHGIVFSPRFAYKWHNDNGQEVRLNLGKGFRAINLFSEEHAALTGSRVVEIKNQLNPEISYNALLNLTQKLNFKNLFLGIDIDLFNNYFTNKIIADYDTDPNKIIYDNIEEHAIVRGIGLNTEWTLKSPITLNLGVTYLNSYSVTRDNIGNKQHIQPVHTPKWQGANNLTYNINKTLKIDVTHQWIGSMRLPILEHDYRPEYSPLYHIINAQISKKWQSIEFYGGAKNILNFTPKNPIMRPFDPFDKYTNDPINNPYNYTFDASYTYASMQGIRFFLGCRVSL